jgi:outer membrane receptor protein involved in Fe transport
MPGINETTHQGMGQGMKIVVRSHAHLVGVSLLAIAAPLSAQEAAAPAATVDESAETIVVTGSRIARDPNAIAPLPIAVVGAEDLQRAGNTDATATLRQLPALLASRSVADSLEGRGENNAGGGIGQAALNLRQLGSNRTLVLVDGRRHVSGVAGEQTVDVATIPPALIEQVEVLTGGASAVYGADAVTGVVNYRLRRDFEGFELSAQTGISSRGDGGRFTLNGTYGRNFAEGRGNVTLSLGYTQEREVLLGDRDFTRDNRRANNSTTYAHPDRRFQKGDISAASTPNFANYFRVGGPGPRASRISFGPAIPQPGSAAFNAIFTGGITPTAAEQALIDRAANAPSFLIAADPRFAISSGQGLIFRNDFDFFGADINGNGINDCNESFIGWTGFGGGGCYVSTAGGGVKIFEDGIISTGSNQFGGDGAVERTSQTSLTPGSERFFAVLKGQYELAPAAELFWDAKYTRNVATSRNNYNTFYDSLLIFPDNPWIPAVLQADADEAGGLRVSRDFLDLGPGITKTERDTYRIVGGVRGDITPNLRYDFGLNYGRTDNAITTSNSVLVDRLFAAIDAVRAPDGRIVCRSDLDPTALHPGSEIFPVIESGFFTFRGGDGQCRPANILNGTNSVSQEAVDFITTPTTTRHRLQQWVATLAFSGDTAAFLNLPGGPVAFAFGGEYREEKSRSNFDPLDLGILPDGTFIGDISANQSLTFDAQTRTFNTGGRFDVKELFGEIRVPLLSERPFFHELSVEAAARYADYSTVGGAFTWNVAGTWAPVPDIRVRGSYSRAIRAPNIAELFEPQQGATFRPADPCNQSTIDTLIANNDPNAQNRLANCRADGIPEGYEDPLTARFSGTSGGNPDLEEERATTWTVGGVIQPRFLPGLTLTADYYSIEIRDAIAAVSAQDIVNTCYDIETFPNDFCALFDRNRTPGSPTFLGLSFLRQTQINFGRIETSGLDLSAAYRFDIGNHGFDLRVAANWTEKLDRFFDPVRTDLANPALRETGVPEWSGVGSLTWSTGPLALTWRTQYIGEQAVASAVQIERVDFEFGEAGIADAYWIHDIAFQFEFNPGFQVYGGINNLTDKEPFIASSAYPVSGIGRSFFLGLRGRF